MSLMVMWMWKSEWRRSTEWGEKYVRLVPEGAQGWRLLARSYAEAGDKEKARLCLARAQSIQP